MEEIRLLKLIRGNGRMQMALDEAIAISCSEGKSLPTLRFYFFDPPAITLGFGQNIKNFNLERISEKGFGYVRRMTAGTAVLHKNDLVYSLVLPEKDLPDEVTDAYNYLSDGLVNGLIMLGLNAEKRKKAAAEDKKRSDSCYLNENPYDVVVNGKKISGNAQMRYYMDKGQAVVLQHGTIIIEDNFGELVDCQNFSEDKKQGIYERGREKITSIEAELGEKPRIEDIEKKMIEGFSKLFEKKGISFSAGDLSSYEKGLAEKLYKDKYNTEPWNHKR